MMFTEINEETYRTDVDQLFADAVEGRIDELDRILKESREHIRVGEYKQARGFNDFDEAWLRHHYDRRRHLEAEKNRLFAILKGHNLRRGVE